MYKVKNLKRLLASRHAKFEYLSIAYDAMFLKRLGLSFTDLLNVTNIVTIFKRTSIPIPFSQF